MAEWFKRATQVAGKLSTQAAEKAAMIAETVTAQSRIHMDYEVAAEVGQCGPEGMWKIHRARPIKNGELRYWPTRCEPTYTQNCIIKICGVFFVCSCTG